MSSNIVDDHLDRMTAKQSAFVREYCADFNQTRAAIRAGYSEQTAAAIGHETLKKPSVKAAIDRRLAELSAAAEVDATKVIAELSAIAFQDSRELMRVEIDCCRHCHGIDHLYHWTVPEYTQAVKKAQRAGEPVPDMEGGTGFDPRRDPHSECPNCFGRGVSTVILTDSRKLSRGAARLMASVRQSAKDMSIEIKTLNQQDALMALARITGALRDKMELSGPGGAPIQLQPVREPRTLSDLELQEALRAAGHPLMLEGAITIEGDSNERSDAREND